MEGCGHIPVWTEQRIERTNARGRHRYCAPFKTWIVEQALRPGMSVAGLAMRNEINANQLRRWIKLRVHEGVEAPAARLLPVTIAAPVAANAATGHSTGAPVEIEASGMLLRVRDDVAPATLRMVLDVLRGMSS